jgi:hypothetical protein
MAESAGSTHRATYRNEREFEADRDRLAQDGWKVKFRFDADVPAASMREDSSGEILEHSRNEARGHTSGVPVSSGTTGVAGGLTFSPIGTLVKLLTFGMMNREKRVIEVEYER